MIVLSCFDGISAGQVALERAGVIIDKYYAAEIDKNAVRITQHNYPHTIQLGNITKWKEWNIEQPDIIIGGSPCQSFSCSGKQLNFDDPRGRLFFTFVDILKHYKPKYFFLENAIMKTDYQNVITNMIGVAPVEINSALVSAQNRRRNYWTNIPLEGLPVDKKILLRDIIESGDTDRDKSYCIDANYFKGGNKKQYIEKSRRQFIKCGADEKPSLQELNVLPNNKIVDKEVNELEKQLDEVLNRLNVKTTRSVQRDATILENCDIVPTKDSTTWRKLTVLECERLQTFPENYTQYGKDDDKGILEISDSRRYHALGNSWTVDVIAWIFLFLVLKPNEIKEDLW